jgi:transcriptional regulator with XRE-family HTH domain
VQPRSPRHAAFGAAIRAIRQERGVSQEDLAWKARIDRAHVGGIERGEENPSLTNVFKLADALEIRASELHARAETMTETSE